MRLTHHLGAFDAHQGLYFLGNYVRTADGRWRRSTFSERLKRIYTPDFVGRMVFGRGFARALELRR